MHNEIHVHKIDETWLRIDCEEHIQRQLQKVFSYKNPNADIIASVKKIKGWNGMNKLYKLTDRKLPFGLLPQLLKFSEQKGYELVLHFEPHDPTELAYLDEKFWFKKIILPFEPYDFQYRLVSNCIMLQRALVLSPTGSGKSLMIYALAKNLGKVLIIDPTVALVHQMRSDIIEYGCNENDIQIIKYGETKEITKPITISTWQSLQNEESDWLNQFDCIIADEVHLFKAKELSGIIQRANKVEHKYGFTGTLEDTLMATLVLQGLFGPLLISASTRELINRGILCDFSIRGAIINHPEYNRKLCARMNYQEEVQYICKNEERNKLILDLADMLDGTTLILFQYIEKHGELLHEILKNSERRKKFYYISGKVKSSIREEYRKEMIGSNIGTDILASFQTFSFGINVPSIENVIIASPSKSRIRILQAIGRALRKYYGKTKATIYDFGDNMQWKRKRNKTMDHFSARVELYNREGFEYSLMQYNLKDDQPWN